MAIGVRSSFGIVLLCWIALQGAPSFGGDEPDAQIVTEADVLAQLRSADPKVVEDGLYAVTRLEPCTKEVVVQLVGMLDDERHGQIVGWRLEQNLEMATPLLIAKLPELRTNSGIMAALEVFMRAKTPNAKVFAVVKPYLGHEEIAVRMRAIRALGRTADDDAQLVATLDSPLADAKDSIRGCAIGVLLEHPKAAASIVNRIGQMLDDNGVVYVAISNHVMTSHKLRADVAKLLGKIGPAAKAFEPRLRNIVIDENADDDSRAWAAMAIASFHDVVPKYVLTYFESVLTRHADEEFGSEVTLEAVADMGEKCKPLAMLVRAAMRHSDDVFRSKAAIALLAIEGENAIPLVIPMLADKDGYVVLTVIGALAKQKAKGPEVVDAYVKALNWQGDDSFWRDDVREETLRALRPMGRDARAALPALEAILTNEGESMYRYLKLEFQKTIEAIRTPR